MAINRVDDIRDLIPRVSNSALGNTMAKKAIHQVLNKMQYGRLVITDNQGGEVQSFGKSASGAEMTAYVEVLDESVYAQVLKNGVTGAGEAYMLGMINPQCLLTLLRVMARNMSMLAHIDNKATWMRSLFLKLSSMVHANNLKGSKRNIAAHYDVGNDFFELFLDEAMMYSSAIYENADDDLAVASVNKLETICQKLQLNEYDHVVEIGTGWGGFACHAAQYYGCKVTTTTISKEQYDEACEKVKRLGLEDKVEVLFKDYRELNGTYDKLVSIEMIEAVGHKYYGEYFSKCAALLKPNGQMLIQAILMNDQRYDKSRRTTDFIKAYIFPGGCLPSYTEICRHVTSKTDLQMMDVHDITYDYAKTLSAWHRAFIANIDAVREQGYSDVFIRMWEFYLMYCQAGFMERSIHTSQIVFAKPEWRHSSYPKA